MNTIIEDITIVMEDFNAKVGKIQTKPRISVTTKKRTWRKIIRLLSEWKTNNNEYSVQTDRLQIAYKDITCTKKNKK